MLSSALNRFSGCSRCTSRDSFINLPCIYIFFCVCFVRYFRFRVCADRGEVLPASQRSKQCPPRPLDGSTRPPLPTAPPFFLPVTRRFPGHFFSFISDFRHHFDYGTSKHDNMIQKKWIYNWYLKRERERDKCWHAQAVRQRKMEEEAHTKEKEAKNKTITG